MKFYTIDELMNELKNIEEDVNYVQVVQGKSVCPYLELEIDGDVLNIIALTDEELDRHYSECAEQAYIDECTREFDDREYVKRYVINR